MLLHCGRLLLTFFMQEHPIEAMGFWMFGFLSVVLAVLKLTVAGYWSWWRVKELEKENSRLRRLVTELSLEKLVLKDVAEGNF
jgi:hypothetical protein